MENVHVKALIKAQKLNTKKYSCYDKTRFKQTLMKDKLKTH